MITSGSDAAPNVGNALFLRDIPLGTVIHNIELQPGKGAVSYTHLTLPTKA